jgi:hypothetical protein
MLWELAMDIKYGDVCGRRTNIETNLQVRLEHWQHWQKRRQFPVESEEITVAGVTSSAKDKEEK